MALIKAHSADTRTGSVLYGGGGGGGGGGGVWDSGLWTDRGEMTENSLSLISQL